jgi:hypothetical protein
MFLPSELGPEELFQSVIENHRDIVAALAAELRKPNEAIIVALDSVAGADPHDYMRGISVALTLDQDAVLRAVVRIWLSLDGNAELAREFLNRLRDAVNTIRP